MRPGDFLLRYGTLIAVLALTANHIALSVLGIANPWPLAVLLPVSPLGLWDVFQQRHTLMRNYPIAAHMRWVFEWLRPFLRQYILEGDLMGRPMPTASRP